MFEPAPVLREIILEPVYMPTLEAVDIDAQPLLDETGNRLRGEDGRVLYGVGG
jgi:hypothetical protein